MEREYAPEKNTIGLPSIADIKKKFPLASNIELKEKLLEYLQQQLDVDFFDCFQANSSKSNSIMDEDLDIENEDMEDYLNDNITLLRSPFSEEVEKRKKDKGLN